MSDQPNPITSGEWTASDITKICDDFPTFWQSALATRINAALAAEQRQVSWMRDVIKRQEQQLAAEQSKLRDAEILCAELQRNRDEIHQQLAAAVEALKVLREHLLIGDTRGRGIIDAALAKLENK